MGVPSKHIWSQRRVIAALGRTALHAAAQHLDPGSTGSSETPGPLLTETVPPLPRDLVRDAVRWAGGSPSAYRSHLPPWLFPQWGFPLLSRTLETIPYALDRVLNAGCHVDIRAPLPVGQPLLLSGQLTAIDDDGRRAILHQRLVTGTADQPEILVVDLQALVPLARGGKQAARDETKADAKTRDEPPRERPRVPRDARELDRWRLGSRAGLDFAKLTGDFNPVHWVPLYARAAGFKNVILHGFGTLARTVEGLNRVVFAGDPHVLRGIGVRFTRPLVLPAKVGLYITPDHGVFVGDAAGGPAYMAGSYTLEPSEAAR